LANFSQLQLTVGFPRYQYLLSYHSLHRTSHLNVALTSVHHLYNVAARQMMTSHNSNQSSPDISVHSQLRPTVTAKSLWQLLHDSSSK